MIPVALCFDKSLQGHYRHVMNSIQWNTKSEIRFYFFVDDTVSLDSIREYRRQGIEVVPVNMGIKKWTRTLVKSKAQFYRWLIPETVTDGFCWYFDNDVVVNFDISKIKIPDGFIVGAAPDCFGYTVEQTERFQGRVEYADKSIKSFLSGQLLINCKKWRDEGITKKLIDFQAANGCADMIALNCVLSGKIYEFGHQYSVPMNHLKKDLTCKGIQYNVADGILHWNGSMKPWNIAAPFYKIYQDYR